ncbi:outer membrane beta-barrel protein [Pseudoflavitalea rhizosphaerae]|uniref:outer membrane beta-barrel protein n=1 Tax=Pseudoflavitalea rhizosphaerae TaxID=1884793 RepID=UPI000F8DE2A7|nr:outer membrane beta-barrel protein [Pseudoflavitalea rhizosphaerae]
MKKTYAVLICGLSFMALITNQAHAQLQKGNILIGADLMGMSADFQSGNTTFNLSIHPKVAWFIQDNIAVGGMVDLGLSTRKGYTAISYGVSALGRYYISDPKTQLLKQSRFFLEGNVGISGQNTKVDGSDNVSTNGLGIGFGPGIAYFITPNISLEGLLKYNLTVGFGNSTTNNQIAFGLGFQIYLPTKKAREVYNDVKSQMK